MLQHSYVYPPYSFRKSYHKSIERNIRFRYCRFQTSDNSYVASFSASLQIHIRRFKYVFLAQPVSATSASVEEHARIIQALENKDRALASSVMKQNLIRPMKELYAFIQNTKEGEM
ncbi:MULTISPECIES: FCD domain-containing protein [Paenibacillus]|uniref:FCD domain-containing protein n=1 Tax=Paenibacillus TaxID=44249 RepID=UPI001AE76F35|nr:FCD domain-containing protein [Paenibacillus lactis]